MGCCESVENAPSRMPVYFHTRSMSYRNPQAYLDEYNRCFLMESPLRSLPESFLSHCSQVFIETLDREFHRSCDAVAEYRRETDAQLDELATQFRNAQQSEENYDIMLREFADIIDAYFGRYNQEMKVYSDIFRLMVEDEYSRITSEQQRWDNSIVLNLTYEEEFEYSLRPSCALRSEGQPSLDELQAECNQLGLSSMFQLAFHFVKSKWSEVVQKGLHLEQAVALHMYTMEAKSLNAYTIINKALGNYRDGVAPNHCRSLIALIQSSIFLLKFPAGVILYRAMNVRIPDSMRQKMQNQERFRIWMFSFSSCSVERTKAEKFLQDGKLWVMFRIFLGSGASMRWISGNPRENEVLLPAFSLFDVVDHRIINGCMEIDLEMIEL